MGAAHPPTAATLSRHVSKSALRARVAMRCSTVCTAATPLCSYETGHSLLWLCPVQGPVTIRSGDRMSVPGGQVVEDLRGEVVGDLHRPANVGRGRFPPVGADFLDHPCDRVSHGGSEPHP